MQCCKSEFLRILVDRGFIKQCTNISDLDAELCKDSCVGYVGFDCTARSLHIGSLLQIMMMRWFQKCGHRPIILLGSATTRIGDPSDKTEMRKMLTDSEIEANKVSLSKVFPNFLDFNSTTTQHAIFVDNWHWLGKLGYLDFLRNYGTHFTINRMLTFDSVKSRLDREQPLTFLEFNYMLLQAYDFVALNREHNCILEFGGSEQWGNIVNGVDLGKRVLGKELYGITTQTIVTNAGHKMGKTAQGAVWLNDDMLSPYDYWQFWRNVDDRDVVRFLKLYTELPLEEIAKYETITGQELNEAKIRLADEATRMCHGPQAAVTASHAAQELFTIGMINDDLPKITIERCHFKTDGGIAIYKLMVQIGICKSGNEAKQLVYANGVKVNDAVVTDPLAIVQKDDFCKNGSLKLSIGRKKHYIVVIR